MQAEDYQFFQTHGYVSLGKIFTDDEVQYFLDAFDRDRANYPSYWYKFGHHQTINCDSLASAPEFDQLIRHPEVMAPLTDPDGWSRLFFGDLHSTYGTL